MQIYDPVDRPQHYGAFEAKYSFQPIDLIRHLTTPAGNSVKYITRHTEKAQPIQDLNKSLKYLEWAKEDEQEYGTTAVLHGRQAIVRQLMIGMAGKAVGVDSAVCQIVRTNYEIAAYIIKKELEKLA